MVKGMAEHEIDSGGAAGMHLGRRGAIAGALTVAAVGGAQMFSGGPAAAKPARDVRHLLDLEDIRVVVDGIDSAVDAKDWARCRAYFTHEIRVDFAALGGGPAGRMPADDLVESWRRNLFAEKASFHMRGNHLIEVGEGTATVRSQGYAFNRLDRPLGGDLWEVWATYAHELVRSAQGWRCSAIGISAVRHTRGNEMVRMYQP
jgi:hypothetical protein